MSHTFLATSTLRIRHAEPKAGKRPGLQFGESLADLELSVGMLTALPSSRAAETPTTSIQSIGQRIVKLPRNEEEVLLELGVEAHVAKQAQAPLPAPRRCRPDPAQTNVMIVNNMFFDR